MFIKTSSRGLLLYYACISVIALVLLLSIHNRQKLIIQHKEQITHCQETITCTKKLHTFINRSTEYCKTYIETESTDALQNLSTSTDTLLRLTDALTELTENNTIQTHKVKLLQLAVNEHVQYIDKIIHTIQNGVSSAISIYNNPLYGSVAQHIKVILSQIHNNEVVLLKDYNEALRNNEKEQKVLYLLLFASLISIFIFRKKEESKL